MELNGAIISSENLDDLEARKSELAYQFWEEDGRPEGKAEEHWNRACLVIMTMEEEPAIEPEWLRRTPKSEAVAEVIEDQAQETKAAETSIETIRRRLVERTAA